MKLLAALFTLLGVLTLPLAAPALAQGSTAQIQGDPVAGKLVYRKCQACHSMEPGQNKVGPSLAGVIGRTAGTLPGYDYSVAMRRSGIVLTPENLDKLMQDPSRFVHGTKMIFTGIKQAKDRADVIAYIASAGGKGPVETPAVIHSAPQTTSHGTAFQSPPTPATAPAGVPQAASKAAAPGAAPIVVASREATLPADYAADVRYTIRSGIAEGRMVFIGVGGAIDGIINPRLTAHEGDVVQITLINGEGAEHDIVFPDQGIGSQRIVGRGASTTLAFRAKAAGDFLYFCSLPGHREAGMEGVFNVLPTSAPRAPVETQRDISMDPSEVPPPIGQRAPQRVQVHLETIELEGRLADGTTYGYWTFNAKVPGPFIRVRVGDTVEVTLKNDPDSSMIHSVDFHAATGPGGGAVHTQAEPGEEKKIEFKALVPGIYVYHCATPMVAHHITNGMYGLILVEPEGGLPPVDHEFYVMQGEIYTDTPFGEQGMQEFSVQKMLDEDAEYVIFNGSVGALTAAHPLRAKVGETVRIFMGVGGPNYTSSFHVIGEIFDRAYLFGDVQTQPARGIQTITIPAGGAGIVDFKLEYPGKYILVDHALARMERGSVGFLIVEGEENPDVYKAYSPASEGSGH